MPEVTIVYWRDIPAQVIVGRGRLGAKRQLAERFEQAIDRCAMRIGAAGTDAYLAEWRKADPIEMAGAPEALAQAEAERLEASYDQAALKALIENDGWRDGPRTAAGPGPA
ncbi:MAG: virulence factor [Pseudomonadota bacterium]